MNKLIYLVALLLIFSACTQVQIGKESNVDKKEAVVQKIESNQTQISQTKEVTNETNKVDDKKTEEELKNALATDNSYELPSSVIDKTNKEIELESFGDVI